MIAVETIARNKQWRPSVNCSGCRGPAVTNELRVGNGPLIVIYLCDNCLEELTRELARPNREPANTIPLVKDLQTVRETFKDPAMTVSLLTWNALGYADEVRG